MGVWLTTWEDFFTNLGETDSQLSHPLGDFLRKQKTIIITGKIITLLYLINKLQKFFLLHLIRVRIQV